MSALEIPYEKRLQILEKRLKGYENNYKFAVANNNSIRQTKYANSIRETKLEINQLERDRPLESNERLRKIIDGLNAKITALQEEVKSLKEAFEAEKQRIHLLLNPPKVIPPEETDLQTNVDHECPKCRRTFKGARGVAQHQRSGTCHKAQ